MFKITILAVGKIRQSFVQIGIDEYLKRLSPYAKISITEVKSRPFTAHNKTKAKAEEAADLLDFLAKKTEARVILLHERGKAMTSVNFANILADENQEIVFVIGGALGFADSILKKYPDRLSLSHMTLPHEIARLVLAEQVYRALTIIKDKDYHY